MAVNVLADPELSSKFVCAALPHPSINLEERMFGGSLPNLFSRVQRPLLLLPAKVSMYLLMLYFVHVDLKFV